MQIRLLVVAIFAFGISRGTSEPYPQIVPRKIDTAPFAAEASNDIAQRGPRKPDHRSGTGKGVGGGDKDGSGKQQGAGGYIHGAKEGPGSGGGDKSGSGDKMGAGGYKHGTKSGPGSGEGDKSGSGGGDKSDSRS